MLTKTDFASMGYFFKIIEKVTYQDWTLATKEPKCPYCLQISWLHG